jgi:hypothetical protein
MCKRGQELELVSKILSMVQKGKPQGLKPPFLGGSSGAAEQAAEKAGIATAAPKGAVES